MPASPRTVPAFGEYGICTVRPVKPPSAHPSPSPWADGSRRSTHSPSSALRPSGPPRATGGWAGSKAGRGAGAGAGGVGAGAAAVAFVSRGEPAQAMSVTAVTRAAAVEIRLRGEVMVTRLNTPLR